MISNAEEVAKKNSRKLYPYFSPNLRKFLEEHGIVPVKTVTHENQKQSGCLSLQMRFLRY